MRLKKEDKKRVEELGLNPKYVYDHGFGIQVYHCINCDGHNLKIKVKGGFQPPEYECQDCKHVSGSPKNTKISKMYEKLEGLYKNLLEIVTS